MSFLNPDREQSSSRKSIHVRNYSWSGGEKETTINGEEVSKVFAEIRYREGSGENTIKGTSPIPMDLPVIGQTFSVSGYDKQGTDAVTYFSNETVKYGTPLKVYKRDSHGIELAVEGSYKEVKAVLGKLIGCEYNVYFYDFDRKCIDRFKFKGSSYGPWAEYVKQIGNTAKYTAPTRISAGEIVRFDMGKKAIIPKFELLTTYSPTQLEELKQVAQKMEEYEASLDISSTASLEAIDQTPTRYEGEYSQELPPAPIPEEANDMLDIPF